MADFFGKSRQVNGTSARSVQAEAPKKRFLSSNARKIGNHHVKPPRLTSEMLVIDYFN